MTLLANSRWTVWPEAGRDEACWPGESVVSRSPRRIRQRYHLRREGQWHGPLNHCQRFVVRVASGPSKTRFRLPAQLCRAGLVIRRVPMKGFCVSALSFPKLSWRTHTPTLQKPVRNPIRVDCNLYPPAIGIGATAALIGSMMANAENSAVASVRSSISASESPSAEILRICSSLIV